MDIGLSATRLLDSVKSGGAVVATLLWAAEKLENKQQVFK
jgi:hypothetical protein